MSFRAHPIIGKGMVSPEPEEAKKPLKTATVGHKKGHPHQDFIDQIVELAHVYGWKAVYWRRPGQLTDGPRRLAGW